MIEETADRPQPPVVFREFVQASDEVFQFLVDDYGFQSLGWEVNGRECTTWFAHSPNVTLMFAYEPLNTPTATVFARLRPDQEKMIETPLVRLARQRIPKWEHPTRGEAGDSVDGLSAVLKIYGELLRETFPEILAAPDGIGAQIKGGL